MNNNKLFNLPGLIILGVILIITVAIITGIQGRREDISARPTLMPLTPSPVSTPQSGGQTAGGSTYSSSPSGQISSSPISAPQNGQTAENSTYTPSPVDTPAFTPSSESTSFTENTPSSDIQPTSRSTLPEGVMEN